jgi:hypothetical protein
LNCAQAGWPEIENTTPLALPTTVGSNVYPAPAITAVGGDPVRVIVPVEPVPELPEPVVVEGVAGGAVADDESLSPQPTAPIVINIRVDNLRIDCIDLPRLEVINLETRGYSYNVSANADNRTRHAPTKHLSCENWFAAKRP